MENLWELIQFRGRPSFWGDAIHYISRISVISEMNELPRRCGNLLCVSFGLGWNAMHSVSIRLRLMASISKETLRIPRCNCNARRCAGIGLGAVNMRDSMAIAGYIHAFAQVLALQRFMYNSH